MNTLFILFGLVLLVLAWFQLRGLHERARAICQRQMRQSGLQLLDDSVAFDGFSLGRPIERCHCLQRCYRFEFTENGSERHEGQLWFCGKQAVFMLLARDDGKTEWLRLNA